MFHPYIHVTFHTFSLHVHFIMIFLLHHCNCLMHGYGCVVSHICGMKEGVGMFWQDEERVNDRRENETGEGSALQCYSVNFLFPWTCQRLTATFGWRKGLWGEGGSLQHWMNGDAYELHMV